MKAIVHRRYGPPDVLEYSEVDKPALTDDGVLVRVRAASVNAFDWHMLRGKPYIARSDGGFRKPKDSSFGVDAAGIVEAVGPNVTHVKPGDEVYGGRYGAFAEYVCGRSFVAKPRNVTCEEAAAVPMAGTTALQAIRDKAHVEAGQRVLVTGASGGVGTFAVQIAKAFGAHVTGLTGTEKLDFVRSLGADEVIDHRAGDFTRGSQRYDVLLDVGGYRRLRDLKRVLAPDGTLVLVGPGRGEWIGPIAHVVAAVVRSRLGRQQMRPFLANTTHEDLLALKDLIEAGKVKPIIDRTFPLSETAAAVRYLESGAARGKVVITV
jgi:NADPH:quinone reductase-like Zn-dependent oxidoreductase